MCVCVCVCVCVITSFVWLGLLVGCSSMIVWTPPVLGVFYACVLYLRLFSTIKRVSHGKVL